MEASNTLEKTLSMFTGVKLKILFLLSVPLSIDEAAAILAASGNMLLDIDYH